MRFRSKSKVIGKVVSATLMAAICFTTACSPPPNGEGKNDAGKQPPVGKQAGEERVFGEIGMRFRWCPPAKPKSGSSTDESRQTSILESPNRHQFDAALAYGFWLGKFSVTREQYQRVMKEKPVTFKGDPLPEDVASSNDASAFCRKLTALDRAAGRLKESWEYRLPTEIQREYARNTADFPPSSRDNLGFRVALVPCGDPNTVAARPLIGMTYIEKHADEQYQAFSMEVNSDSYPFYQGNETVSFQAVAKRLESGDMVAVAHSFDKWRNLFAYENTALTRAGQAHGGRAVGPAHEVLAEARVVKIINGLGAEVDEYHYTAEGDVQFYCKSFFSFPDGAKRREWSVEGKKQQEYFFMWTANGAN